MTELAIDGRVHHQVMQAFVRRGFPPTVDEVAAALGDPADDVEAALRRLHDGHGLVLHPGALDVWIAHPFSATPTAVWVAARAGDRAGDRGWWAPCLWCATGVVTLAAPDATLHVRLGGEHAEVAIAARDGVIDDELVVHFAIPPRDAWRNVVHWCATVLPFRAAADVPGWCARHGLAPGAVVPIQQVMALGRVWYGRHLDEAWGKWTVAEAQAIFTEVGLTGAFWQLPGSSERF